MTFQSKSPCSTSCTTVSWLHSLPSCCWHSSKLLMTSSQHGRWSLRVSSGATLPWASGPGLQTQTLSRLWSGSGERQICGNISEDILCWSRIIIHRSDLSYNQYGTGKRIPIHSQCLSSPGLDYVMIVIQSQHRNTEQSLFLLGRPEWYWWCLFVSNYSWSIICVSLGMESTTGTGTTGLRGWRTLSRYKSCHRFENKNFPLVPLSSHSLNRQIGAVWTRFTYKLHLKVCNFISSLLKWKTTILGFSFFFLKPPKRSGWWLKRKRPKS